MTVEGCNDCLEPREVCTFCHRPRANEHDEDIHNTGACGCDESRSLCWFLWNGYKCLPLSIYDPNSDEK